MEQVPWLEQREARAWRALQFMNLQLDGELARRLATDSPLSYSDYTVLVALTAQTEGTMRLFELGRDLGWEKSRLSHHITRMVKRGLVEKRRCDSDRRGAFVAVTAQGRREIEAAAPGHLRAVRELFVDHVSDEQLEIVAEVAETVLHAMQAIEPDYSDES